MGKDQEKPGGGYNERLFSAGLRKWVHEARFFWLRDELQKRDIKTAAIVEIGCFDGRALDYIGRDFGSYRGFDADWEGGLSSAREKVADSRVSFHKCISPEGFIPEKCDVVISLETLEHIDPSYLPEIYNKINKNMSLDGVFLLSVPNELGILFAIKQLYKKFFLEGAREYTLREAICQTFGFVGAVERREHKGFSWRKFRKELGQYFDIQEVKGLQIPYLPNFVNPSIGIVAKKKI